MATQEEVLQAVVENKGVISFKKLKERFGIGKSGSSWLPQRLKALENKKLVFRIRVGNETFFIADPDLVKFDFRGRPAGSFKVNAAMEHKVLRFVEERKIVSWRQIRDGLGWDTKTLNKYIKSLLEKNMLIEWDTGTLLLYMTPATLDEIINSYYVKLYNFHSPHG